MTGTIGTYKYIIADTVWQISPRFEFNKWQLMPFCTYTERPEIVIEPCGYDTDEESELLFREINTCLLRERNGLVLHSSAIIYSGKAYLFVAPSGTSLSR